MKFKIDIKPGYSFNYYLFVWRFPRWVRLKGEDSIEELQVAAKKYAKTPIYFEIKGKQDE